MTLPQRAIVCPKWRWMLGMVDESGDRVIKLDPDDPDGVTIRTDNGWVRPDDMHHPDLQDSATLGCLLALVREAYAPGLHTRPHKDGWACFGYPGPYVAGIGATEAEALIVALENAP